MVDEKKSATGKAIGGKARAAALTPEKRKEISQKALSAKREMAKLPKATHSGSLEVGGQSLACFVLDDGRRVISGRGLTAAIGMKGRGQGAARIAGHKLIKSYQNKDLSVAIDSPIKFVGKSPRGDNIPSDGFEATVLQEICEAILTARDMGLVTTEQDHRYAAQADLLMRGFARVGIIALVDEATGYQKDRARDALAKILEAYVAKELQPWVKTFPIDYYEHMCRLRGLPFPSEGNTYPPYFGTLTNNVVYDRLAPGLRKELKAQAAKDQRKARLHQRLTADIGHPKLREHLASVVTVMKLSRDYQDFEEKLESVHPKLNDQMKLDL
ncbi:P63C domain-containing protein [Stenotrophomonas maltophilia]|uniref:P63C domain-containing protein n=1 Tax=Stenotrophomonas maltophilia group TaxID=995085 RepID=UPI000709DEE5|nr:P63C domain-containing protein [Stenotrophomonas maltophilia]KRG61612.1 oxygenase [Stenotrophomonas maltophilia]NNH46604.1 oxygenase [Stenotrophomonas maltophilia]VEE52100.1 P63C domain [Stenotrophomonas maltophilia]